MTSFGEYHTAATALWYSIANFEARSEYSYKQKQFIIYMPTAVHSAFARDYESEIREMLKKLASTADNGVIAKLAENIRIKGDGRIQPPDIKIGESFPDGSFQLRGCAYPGLVIEVAWSQEQSDSVKKAERYFRNFQGEVRTVVLFNLNDIYRKQEAAKQKWFRDKKKDQKKKENSSSSSRPLTFLAPAAAATSATFSVWRAHGTAIGEDSVRDQVKLSKFHRVIFDSTKHRIDLSMREPAAQSERQSCAFFARFCLRGRIA